MIVLDAGAVIYLTKKHQSGEDGIRGRKVQKYLDAKVSIGASISVPTVALSEVFAAPNASPDPIFEMLDDYEILEFDSRAAVVAGEIAGTTNWKAGLPPFPGGRQVVKLDILIAATGIAHGVTEILTNDNRYDRFTANRPIRVVLIDSLPSP